MHTSSFVVIALTLVGSSASAMHRGLPASLAGDRCTRLEPVTSAAQTVSVSEMMDIKVLYNALKALASPKDQFETTAQYEERLARLRSQPLEGGKSLYDTLSVLMPISNYFFKYDADKQAVRVEHMLGFDTQPFGLSYPSGAVPPHSAYEDRFGDDMRTLELARDRRSGRTYEASNAYGAKADVEVSHVTEHNLVLMNVEGNITCTGQHVEFSAPPDEARGLRDNLAAVVRFVIRRPYIVESTFHSPPRIDRPREIFSTEYNVIGRATEVLLIDNRNKRVIQAFSPETPEGRNRR